MELREEQALLLEHIHRWRVNDGIAEARVTARADVVGHDEDDVGFRRHGLSGSRVDDHRQQQCIDGLD
jgi:hypothetical protein